MIQIAMTDREKVIKEFEHLLNAAKGNYQDFIDLTVDGGEEILALLKEQEAATEYIIDEYQPTCKACGFRPFAGYIPTLEWMRERGFKFCPKCGRAVKWDEQP